MRTQLQKDEKVTLLTRRHWFPSLFLRMLFYIVVLLLCLTYAPTHKYLYIPAAFVVLLAIYRIYERKYNIWAVTNLRVIDESGVFKLFSKESPLDKINNVSYSQGLLGRILGYGNVAIQTAAGYGTTTYVGVENPRRLKDTITTMQENQRKDMSMNISGGGYNLFQQPGSPTHHSLADELEHIHSLKERGILTEEEYHRIKERLLK
jgi:membrane protein YdbS with pleckstrin-like domain